MSISKAAYEQILREYDEKQLAAKRKWRQRIEDIEAELPELAVINSRISSLTVSLSIARIQKKPEMNYAEELEQLFIKKALLLENAGYTSADLEPQYECSECKDTGYVDGIQCNCFKSRITDFLYDQSGIKDTLNKENFQNYSFKYYSPEPVSESGASALSIAKSAVASAIDFIKNFDSSRDNLFITGETGVGKTFLTNCIAKELLDRGRFVVYLSSVKLFKLMADATFAYSGSETNHVADHLLSCDLLIIDDLGTEFTNSLVRTSLFDIVNERILRGKHTIISTNLSIEQLRDNYSERIFSRITENYILIKLIGKDIRIQKKLEA